MPETTSNVVERTEVELRAAVRRGIQVLTGRPDTPTLQAVVDAGLSFALPASDASMFRTLRNDIFLLTGQSLPCCVDCDDDMLADWFTQVRDVFNTPDDGTAPCAVLALGLDGRVHSLDDNCHERHYVSALDNNLGCDEHFLTGTECSKDAGHVEHDDQHARPCRRCGAEPFDSCACA